MRYDKPALTFDEQVELLEKRGLVIEDREKVKSHLSNISYYRLSAYMLPYKEKDGKGGISDTFKKGTKWENIYDTYKFDRKLRLLIFDAIERIEISLRSQIIYQLSHKYGSHWQDNRDIFVPARRLQNGKMYSIYTDIQKHIKEQLQADHKAIFIKHYQEKYDTPTNPPSWMCAELLYFSELSQICQSLKLRKDRTGLSKAFGIADDRIFCSWLHTLNYVRNICAHHARLWNTALDITPTKYKNKTSLIWLTEEECNKVQPAKLYFTLCIILYLLQTVNPETTFPLRFKELLRQYPIINERVMGFPKGWRGHPLWNI